MDMPEEKGSQNTQCTHKERAEMMTTPTRYWRSDTYVRVHAERRGGA